VGALPTDPAERKGIPLATGVLDYFTAALAEVAKVSKAGNEQHNPGQPLHWARGKSTDQADTLLRHLAERGTIDTDGMRHSAKLAWRALALLQLELEEAGAPLARGARLPEGEEYGPITDFVFGKDYSKSHSGATPCNVTGEVDGETWYCERIVGHDGPHACPKGHCSDTKELRWPR
jgi:hypothetical protein